MSICKCLNILYISYLIVYTYCIILHVKYFEAFRFYRRDQKLILAAKALVSIEMGGRNPNWYRRQQEGVRNKEHSESHTTDRSMIEANASFFCRTPHLSDDGKKQLLGTFMIFVLAAISCMKQA